MATNEHPHPAHPDCRACALHPPHRYCLSHACLDCSRPHPPSVACDVPL